MASVIVISDKGENLGLMDYKEAVNLAKDMSLDLVEVGKKDNLQIFKVMDRGKWLYERKKALKKSQQQHSKDLKEIRFRLDIAKHDEDIKLGHIREFINKGHSVQISIIMKGREKHFIGNAYDKMDYFINLLSDIAKCTPLKKNYVGEGDREFRINTTATPIKLNNKTERTVNG